MFHAKTRRAQHPVAASNNIFASLREQTRGFAA
jgi:hypothetical protein